MNEFSELLIELSSMSLQQIAERIYTLEQALEPIKKENKELKEQITKIQRIVNPYDFLPRDSEGNVVKPRRGRPRKDTSIKNTINEGVTLFTETMKK